MNVETKSTLDVFKNYYSTLADNPLTPPKKYTFNSVIAYNIINILFKMMLFVLHIVRKSAYKKFQEAQMFIKLQL